MMHLKKLYFNALNVPKDMAPWGGIMYGFRVRKRVKQIIEREGIPRYAWYSDNCYLNLCYTKNKKLEQFGVWKWRDEGVNIKGWRLIKEEFEEALAEAGCPNVEVDNSDGFDYMREEWIGSGE